MQKRVARARAMVTLLGVSLLPSCGPEADGIRRLPLEPFAAPAKLTVDPDATTLGFIGATDTLTARVVDADGGRGTTLSLSWTTTNPTVATVSGSGVVRAVSEGSTRIIVRLVNLVDTATVTVRRIPATVSLDATSLLFTQLGATRTLLATVADGGGQALPASGVTWSSADSLVAKVSSTGTVTAVGQGTTTVRATAGAIQRSATVRVATGPASVEVVPGTVALSALGDTVRLKGTVRDAAGGALGSVAVVFLWGDTLVAHVDSAGLITARGTGTTTVTVIGDSLRKTVPVTVTQTPTSILVSPESATLTPGGTITLGATVADRNGNKIASPGVTWSSGSAAVATVSSAGKVTAVAAGSTTIVGSAGTVKDTANITVASVTIDSVAVSPDSVSVQKGKTTTLSARFFTATGTEVFGPTATWSSSATAVATVSATGLVTGVDPGNAWIKATKDAGVDSTYVTVTAPPSQFDIVVRFVGTTPSSAVQASFAAAEARWEAIIIGDLANVTISATAAQCGISHPAVNETVDDLLIYAEVTAIDGVGGVLGQAGPCLVRSSGSLAVLGVMQFDEADLGALLADGDLDETVIHEMGHVLGLGASTPWENILVGKGGSDPYWPGTEAVARYTAAGGTAVNKVPVANTGGTGTRDAHWRESDMGRELMTGFLNAGVVNPLSAITIGAMKDMGYTVDVTQAESYTVSATLRAGADRLIELRELPRPAPWVVDADGRVIGRAPR